MIIQFHRKQVTSGDVACSVLKNGR